MGVSPNQSFAQSIVIFFACASTVVIALRLWSRKLRRKSWGADDLLMIPGWMCAVAMTGTTLVYIDELQIGVHTWDLDPEKSEIKGQMYLWIDSMLYTPAMFFVRSSILLFLARLDQAAKVRYWLWAAAIWCTLSCVMWFVYFPLKCIPIQKLWDPDVPGVCSNVGLGNTIGCALWIFGDLFIAVIPTILLYNLQIPRAKKIAIIIILSLGWFVVAASALRFVYMIRLYYTDDDLTFDLTFLTCHLEANLSVITGCSPHSKPVFMHWFKGVRPYSPAAQYSKDPRQQQSPAPAGQQRSVASRNWRIHGWRTDVLMSTLTTVHRSESTEGLREESEEKTWDSIQKTTQIDVTDQP